MENNTCLSRALCALCTYGSYVYYAILKPYIGSIQTEDKSQTNLTLAPGGMVLTVQYIDDSLMQKKTWI